MKITTAEFVNQETSGTGVEISDDDSYAALTIYLENGGTVKAEGTAKQLRRLGRAIISGLKRERVVREVGKAWRGQ